jgi:hypothetical protein
MKLTCLLIVLLWTSSSLLAAQSKLQQGTIVRMQMGECMNAEHGLMAALAGAPHVVGEGICPEYVLVGDKVVYVIVGKTSTALVPLAETTKFRFQNNELLIRIDDAKHESRFGIKQMVLRSEWDQVHPTLMQEIESPSPRRVNAAQVMEQSQ